MTERENQRVPDGRALQILDLVAEAHQGMVPGGAEVADLARALGQAVDTTGLPAPSDAEAAGIALELLADDPVYAGPIDAMRHGPETKALGLGVVEGTFLITGLLLALQTHFEFVRDKEGRWSIKIKKKPTSDALLKPLIKKLTDLLGG